ncbi:SMC-Scp complex subunit ScpB [Solemya velum gill symbiont]|nr:SMC-Scp complex subunit ScpB [Solemya velum gill symbiont]OOZ15637.1 SMC-Scp complex subunit ScpB [Solemya velum gill symbiont]OOZ20450.1 SMC-Scp complex subunit ScpB [Solemya velum gill symbiont]OOZ22324.1 SMC-Scp complex subunit ScpB [Solemya velum gill symbiont]OOZ24600.1 SMC-Scp complex subunit ScpB [Solemya velum gill symbiont]OOZ30094.1 SMC-Scp complex subunit ScpB [Solemya velum gill symbiont]
MSNNNETNSEEIHTEDEAPEITDEQVNDATPLPSVEESDAVESDDESDTPAESDLKNTVEAALLAAGKPLSLDVLLSLFLDEQQPDRNELRDVLEQLQQDFEGRGIEIVEVASGWRIQVRKQYSTRISRLWEEKPGRYSRAMLETLALIAYRQPITRGEIEEIRGVAVSTNIVKTMLERDWVQVVGQRDVPGRPSLYATTREFLDYFGLKSLADLPTLSEIKDLDELNRKLNLPEPDEDIEKADAANEAVLNMDPDGHAEVDEEAESGSGDDSDLSNTEAETADRISDPDEIESDNEPDSNDESDREAPTFDVVAEAETEGGMNDPDEIESDSDLESDDESDRHGDGPPTTDLSAEAEPESETDETNVKTD